MTLLTVLLDTCLWKKKFCLRCWKIVFGLIFFRPKFVIFLAWHTSLLEYEFTLQIKSSYVSILSTNPPLSRFMTISFSARGVIPLNMAKHIEYTDRAKIFISVYFFQVEFYFKFKRWFCLKLGWLCAWDQSGQRSDSLYQDFEHAPSALW